MEQLGKGDNSEKGTGNVLLELRVASNGWERGILATRCLLQLICFKKGHECDDDCACPHLPSPFAFLEYQGPDWPAFW